MTEEKRSLFHRLPVARFSLLPVLLLLFPAVFLAGCASTEDIGRLQYDLIDLRSEVNDLKRSGVGQVGKRLNDLEEEQKTTGTAVSDLFMKVQSLTSEFQVLMGNIEEAKYLSETSSRESEEKKNALILKLQELEATVAELEKRLSAPGPESSDTTEKKRERGTWEVEARQPEVDSGARKEPVRLVREAYMSAYTALKNERYSEAREQFGSLLKDYPENEYSDNARFWIADSFYREKNYEESILAYEELLKKNPKSEKVPGALLKQGLAFYELKDPDTGKIILEKVIADFPESEQAGIARKKLRPPTPAKNMQ
jgi:tol-pal system protein YbgF